MNRLLNGVRLFDERWQDGFTLHAIKADGKVTGYSISDDDSEGTYNISFVSSQMKDAISGVLSNPIDWRTIPDRYAYQFPITLISRELDDGQEEH